MEGLRINSQSSDHLELATKSNQIRFIGLRSSKDYYKRPSGATKKIGPYTEPRGTPIAASATCNRDPLTLTWKERRRR